jgi:hypothetical protein
VLLAEPAVLGLVLLGSYTGLYAVPDYWSDLDLVVVVRDEDYPRFFPGTDWLKPFGVLYTTETTDFGDFGVRRCQFTNFWRLDMDVVGEGSLRRMAEWSEALLTSDRRVVFCRSEVLAEALTREVPQTPPAEVTAAEFDRLATEFWFKGMLAVTKLAREEMLVGLHLALDMVRDCSVLAMMLRDRDTGSNHHRDGRDGNQYIPLLAQCHQSYTVEGLLDTMVAAATVFDGLAARMDAQYVARRETLLEYTNVVRRSRHGSAGRETT